MRGFHTAALVAVVALALCAGGAADTNIPQTRGAGASNIGTAGARPSLNITTTAERPQGSDADEFTRGRRPSRDGNRKKPYRGKPHGNEYKPFEPQPPVTPSPSHSQHCDNVVVECSGHSDCLSRFPCKFATCEPNHEKKKNKKKKKKVRWGRSDEDDEKDQPEEYERQSNSGTCVCGGNKPGPCLFPGGFPDDCTSIRTDVGICSNGICKAEPRDEGCPCGADPDSCITGDINENCLYADQKCKCDGDTDDPVCVPNFLSRGTICSESEDGCTVGKCDSFGACLQVVAVDGTPCEDEGCTDRGRGAAECLINSPTKCICEGGSCAPNYLPAGSSCASDDSGPCEVSTCSAIGECVFTDVLIGTGCFDGDPLCTTAGKCALDTSLKTSRLVCEKFDCDAPVDPDCSGKTVGEHCGRGVTCCPNSGGGLDCIDAGSPDATCPCFETGGSCFFEGNLNGFCCPLSTGGPYECVKDERACLAATPCAGRELGDACGPDKTCCVQLSDPGTFPNFNIECLDGKFCPCGVCTITGDTQVPYFGDANAYCAPNSGEATAECTLSCSTCQFGTLTDPPYLRDSCANANGRGSCESFSPADVSSLNMLCPQTQTCIACKASNGQSGECKADGDP